jgi:uncharacterized protein (TIGR02588 family)
MTANATRTRNDSAAGRRGPDAKRATAAESGRHAADWLERAATWASAAIVLALLALLAWDAARSDAPPAFRTQLEPPRAAGSSFHVPVTVHNVGDAPAQGVEVTVSVRVGDSTAAEGSFTIDWLPGRSSRRGVAVLAANPTRGRIAAEVRGYTEP